jgi:putative transposase
VTKKRRKHNDRFKFKVALEAVKEQITINEIASKNNIHPNQVSTWKKKLLVEGQTVFGQQTAKKLEEQSARETKLFEHIGRLKMELEWLKKKAAPFE